MSLDKHYMPKNLSDKVALGFTKFLRFLADTFFKKRYGHRAVVLETVAAVPGMVAGMLLHLKSLRKMQDDKGWIKILLDEAENERMHLMTFIHIAKPTLIERIIILIAQFIFIITYAMHWVVHVRLECISYYFVWVSACTRAFEVRVVNSVQLRAGPAMGPAAEGSPATETVCVATTPRLP